MLVVGHKRFDCPDIAGYTPVIVGKKDFEMPSALRDDAGENISEKNPFYCELTALYWAWKNMPPGFDVIGLCHYRRFFSLKKYSNSSSFFVDRSLAVKLLQNNDVILPNPIKWECTVAEAYYDLGAGKQKDLETAREAIAWISPEYLESFNSVISSYEASYCNMFIMKRTNMDKYCSWLFEILEYCEDNIDMEGYSPEERRVFGFLGEILLNVWIRKNKLKAGYLNSVNTSIPSGRRLYMDISATVHSITKHIL